MLELLLVDRELLVVAERNDARVVGKRPVDKLGGEDGITDREADLALRQFDGNLGLAILD